MENAVSIISKKLRPKEAAEYLGLAPSTLAKMRLRGDGPPYAKLGKRVVVYETCDLERWVAERKRVSTSALVPRVGQP